MHTLSANLKHLYQCRTMMVMNLFLIPIIFFLPMSLFKIGQPKACPMALPMLFVFTFSTMLSSLAADNLRKPFVFCLPDHEKTVRKMLLFIWAAMVVLFLMVAGGVSIFGSTTGPVVLFGGIALLSLSYWVGTACLTRIQTPTYLLFFLAAFLSLNSFTIDSILSEHPWRVGLACSAVCLLIYCGLGRGRQGRRLCASPLPLFVYSGKGRKIDFIPTPQTKRKPPSRAAVALGRFFENRIRARRASELGAGLWGQVYLVTGAFLNRGNPALLFMIVFPLFLDVFSQSEPSPQPVLSVIMSLMAGVIGGAICSVHHFESITLLSRKVLLIRSITAALIATVFIAGLLALAVFLNNSLVLILPEVRILGKAFQLAPVSWVVPAFVAPLVPLFGGIMVLFKQYLTRIFVLCLTVAAVMILSIVSIINIENASPGAVLAGFLIAAAVTWGFHLGVLYFDSMKQSLC